MAPRRTLTVVSTDLAVDRLPEAGPSVEVVLLEDASYGAGTGRGPRRPHRHDYHELIWTRCGEGHQLVDGEVSAVEPNTIALIARGQVHVFERAVGLYGAVVRFGDELLHTDPTRPRQPEVVAAPAAALARPPFRRATCRGSRG